MVLGPPSALFQIPSRSYVNWTKELFIQFVVIYHPLLRTWPLSAVLQTPSKQVSHTPTFLELAKQTHKPLSWSVIKVMMEKCRLLSKTDSSWGRSRKAPNVTGEGKGCLRSDLKNKQLLTRERSMFWAKKRACTVCTLEAEGSLAHLRTWQEFLKHWWKTYSAWGDGDAE
jgi:hypothetical protein